MHLIQRLAEGTIVPNAKSLALATQPFLQSIDACGLPRPNKAVPVLPDQLCRELDQTRRPCRGDASEVGAIACVSVGLLKLRVIPGVK